MIGFTLGHQQDLEDAFKLDCSAEDLKTDKGAKRCFKIIKKCRKQTQKYYDFLHKIGITEGVRYENKTKGDLYYMSRRTNDSNSRGSSGGIGFVGLLTVAFIVLKLCNVINWSWLWVLSPMWITAIVVVIFLIVTLICVFSRASKY